MNVLDDSDLQLPTPRIRGLVCTCFVLVQFYKPTQLYNHNLLYNYSCYSVSSELTSEYCQEAEASTVNLSKLQTIP